MATLADVARRARVSPATASRIISGSSKRVTDHLRARVLAAVEELQYVPNANAQSLARMQRSAIGVIVHDVSDPYFAEITRGLQRIATENGRLVIICNSYRDPERELEYVELLRAHQAAAIILAGSGYHDSQFAKSLNQKLEVYERTGGRVTVIGRHQHATDAVMPANESGGYLAAAELFRLGHKQIGVIAGPKALTTTSDRLAGLRRAAKDYGRRLVRTVYAEFDRDSGEAAAASLLDSNPHLTAIAALNDSMAIGAMATLRQRGRRVPEQVSVIGFDDMPIARDVTPALTTIRLPLSDIGAMAMKLALEDGIRDRPPRIVEIGCEVVRRESTAPPA